MAAHVQVILSRDVMHLGNLGEVVKVRPGYARNFLFPKLLALPVSESRMKQLDHKKRLVEHQRQKLKVNSEGLKSKLAELQISISAKAGKEGKLFGSIGTRDIEAALAEKGVFIPHRDIKLEHPIKTVGLHSVDVRLEADVRAAVNLVVIPKVAEEVKAKDDTAEAVRAEVESTDEQSADENIEG